MKLIGLTGKARSGKDTVAKILWAKHEYTRLAFADPLKMAAREMFGLSMGQAWDDTLKEVVIPHWGMTPRQMLQLLGTEAVKPVFGSDIWVKRWKLSYDILKDTDNIVVTDTRFDAEAAEIRSLGGVIVEVRRGNGLVGAAGNHASERGLTNAPDFILDNDGTLEDLQAKVEALAKELA